MADSNAYRRWEIVLLAACVLVLVSILAVIIIVTVGFEPPIPKEDLENPPNSIPWKRSWTSSADWSSQVKPYRDKSFVAAMRRRSSLFAEELKNELEDLTKRRLSSVASLISASPPLRFGAGNPAHDDAKRNPTSEQGLLAKKPRAVSAATTTSSRLSNAQVMRRRSDRPPGNVEGSHIDPDPATRLSH